MGHRRARSALFACVLASAWLVGGRAGTGLVGTAPGEQTQGVARAAVELAALPRTASSAPAPPVDSELPRLEVERNAFFGEPDAPIRDALHKRAVVKVERGRGGRSLGFRIALEGGQKGYFKPEQTFSAANWFGEVAAYHLDRLLGLGRVPAVVSRILPWAPLEAAAGSDARKEEVIVRDGVVRGAFVAWVEGDLEHMEQQEQWEQWLRLTRWRVSEVSPYQRASVWRAQMARARRMGREWRNKEERDRLRRLHPEPVRADRPAELSDLIVFDYLTRNLDRWGGNNGNVLIRGDKGPLLFMDNGAGFEPGDQRPTLVDARLHVLERFRRSTIEAIRAFDIREFEARLASEAVTPVLSRAQLDGLEERRKALLERVAELEALHGEAIWAWD